MSRYPKQFRVFYYTYSIEGSTVVEARTEAEAQEVFLDIWRMNFKSRKVKIDYVDPIYPEES
jgi:hypothetical protein